MRRKDTNKLGKIKRNSLFFIKTIPNLFVISEK